MKEHEEKFSSEQLEYAQASKSKEAPEIKKEPASGKIDDDHWQKKLDLAFANKDDETVFYLRQVRQNMQPSADLINKRLHEMISQKKIGEWKNELDNLRETINIDPNSEVFQIEIKKLLDQVGRESGIIS